MLHHRSKLTSTWLQIIAHFCWTSLYFVHHNIYSCMNYLNYPLLTIQIPLHVIHNFRSTYLTATLCCVDWLPYHHYLGRLQSIESKLDKIMKHLGIWGTRDQRGSSKVDMITIIWGHCQAVSRLYNSVSGHLAVTGLREITWLNYTSFSSRISFLTPKSTSSFDWR